MTAPAPMDARVCPPRACAALLAERHYLGPAKTARFAWLDEFGCAVFAGPRSRRLPGDWIELVRWCLTGGANAGSRQWRALRGALAQMGYSTVVSYSDPSQGHTGALYRACGFLWAPTWHRLRPPPSGNGDWGRARQAVKDRWVFPLRPDPDRALLLAVKDPALMRRRPAWQYREPRWRGNRFDPRTGGGDFTSFAAEARPHWWRACLDDIL